MLRSTSLALAICLAAAPAAAQDGEHRLGWSDDWARVHPAAYVVSTVGVAGSLVFDHVYDPGPEAFVTGPILADAAFRDALASDSEEGREAAAGLSDILLGALILWPLVDSLGVAGIGDGNSDVAWQLTMVAAESIAADFVLSTVFKLLVHRERPHGSRCSVEDRTTNPGRCGVRGRTRSFYSGHASAAFNGAGLICISHANLPLYASDAADAFACGAAMLTASIVGVLRMIADRHHFSDVLTGSVMGLLTGLLLPYALHYGWDPTPDEEPAMSSAPLRQEAHFPLLAGAF